MKIIKNYDLSLKKIYGQNFIIDTNVLKKITEFSQINKKDNILEIGPGIGSLTEIMLDKSKIILCIEIDKKLSEVFKEIFSKFLPRKIIFISGDAMKIDYSLICDANDLNKLVSNLPYKVAFPVILRICAQTDKINDFFATIQKDIADRILARPGDKNYNASTVKINFYCSMEDSFSISKNCFFPKPHVDSVTVHLKRRHMFFPSGILEKLNPLLVSDILKNENKKKGFTEDFFKFVEDSFCHRRKKLLNSLNFSDSIYKVKEKEIIAALSSLNKNKDIRPEELSLEDYLTVFILISDPYKYFFIKD